VVTERGSPSSANPPDGVKGATIHADHPDVLRQTGSCSGRGVSTKGISSGLCTLHRLGKGYALSGSERLDSFDSNQGPYSPHGRVRRARVQQRATQDESGSAKGSKRKRSILAAGTGGS